MKANENANMETVYNEEDLSTKAQNPRASMIENPPSQNDSHDKN